MPTVLENSVFLFIPLMVALVAGYHGVRAWMGYREVRRDALEDYRYREMRGMLPPGVGREAWQRAFERMHAPRANLYTAIGLGAIVVLTLPFLRLADLVMTVVWKLSGESRVFEPTFLVYQFGIFFGMIALWASIGYVAARAYHRGTPLSFDDELARETGGRVRN